MVIIPETTPKVETTMPIYTPETTPIVPETEENVVVEDNYAYINYEHYYMDNYD